MTAVLGSPCDVKRQLESIIAHRCGSWCAVMDIDFDAFTENCIHRFRFHVESASVTDTAFARRWMQFVVMALLPSESFSVVNR